MMDGNALEDAHGGWRRQGECAVSAMGESGSERHGRRPHFIDAEEVERQAGPDDVDNRIDGSDLVEMDLLDGHAMGPRFGLAEQTEYFDRPLLNSVGQDARLDQVDNFSKPARVSATGRIGVVVTMTMTVTMTMIMIVIVGMRVRVLVVLVVRVLVGVSMFVRLLVCGRALGVLQPDVETGGMKRAPEDLLGFDSVPIESEALETPDQTILLEARVDQSAEKHITANSREGIKI